MAMPSFARISIDRASTIESDRESRRAIGVNQTTLVDSFHAWRRTCVPAGPSTSSATNPYFTPPGASTITSTQIKSSAIARQSNDEPQKLVEAEPLSVHRLVDGLGTLTGTLVILL